MGARNARAEVRRRVLTASRDDRADAALFERLSTAGSSNLSAGMGLPLCRPTLVGSAAVTLTKGLFPSIA